MKPVFRIYFFKVYRQLISPMIHGGTKIFSASPFNGCKFEPTCSCYCEQAIEKYGAIKGGAKGLVRILKCHPLSRSGGYDPV